MPSVLAENAPEPEGGTPLRRSSVQRSGVPGTLDSIVENPDNYITVKELLPSQDEADREVERLIALNEDKDCVCFLTITRLYPKGRGMSRD